MPKDGAPIRVKRKWRAANNGNLTQQAARSEINRNDEDQSAETVIAAGSLSCDSGGARPLQALKIRKIKRPLKDDDLIPRWSSPSMINVVVVGGQTNPCYQVANMSYSRSVSIDKWM